MKTPMKDIGNSVTKAQAKKLAPRASFMRGHVIDGFKVIAATDMVSILRAIGTAGVSGSVGAVEIEYSVAGPRVMPEDRDVVRFARVERVAKPG